MNGKNRSQSGREEESRRAFIGLCIAMAGCDSKMDIKEISKLRRVMDRYGFSEKEVVRELKEFSKMNIEEALLYGRKCMAALPELDEDLQKRLLISLTEIALAEDDFEETEMSVMNTVMHRIGND
ncbi:TerB family tellurite resistance protein [Candidatus Marinimicrobia bacterium MT.SAG.3]|nr:TerB family tellurite resistance protein [Candidatus Marinimicrobia bacterium MT.SAG.3]